MVLNVLVENSNFQPAQVADADAWRRRLSVVFPVLADAQAAWVEVWGNPNSTTFSQHSYTLVGADGIVVWRQEENRAPAALIEAIVEQIEAL